MIRKYTDNEIDRIMNERVYLVIHESAVRTGLIGEWSFTYPTGDTIADVECAFPINENDYNYVEAYELILQKVEQKVRDICVKYTIGTGDRL